MTPIRGPIARVDRSREELAKAFLVRLIERASLDEIRDLPTERIARELPALISDILQSVAGNGSNGSDPYKLADDQVERAVSLAALRGGRDGSVSEVARDVASLQAVLVRALREELAENEPEQFADAVEHLVDATGAIQAAVTEELVAQPLAGARVAGQHGRPDRARQPPPPPARDRPPARSTEALRPPLRRFS